MGGCPCNLPCLEHPTPPHLLLISGTTPAHAPGHPPVAEAAEIRIEGREALRELLLPK